MIKNIIFITISLILSNRVLTKTTTYRPHPSLPLEFIFLVNSYQNYALNDKESHKFKQNLSFFEIAFAKLNKTEIHNIVKSQTYKTIINFLVLKKTPLNFNVDDAETFLKERIKSSKYQLFSKWLMSAFYKDLNNIIKKKLNSKVLSKKMKKKFKLPLSLLFTWVEFIQSKTFDEFQNFMKILSDKIFSNIKKRTREFILFSQFEKVDFKKKLSKKNFFIEITKDGENKTTQEKNPSKILEILAPISEDSLILPGVLKHKKEWMPKEGKKNINIDPPQPNPNYIPPRQLPEPVNNWGH
jgi:hypothetical protein